jgi:hypothetical protein
MYELTSDYVIRRTSDSCGPSYRQQQGAETCEWFVHDLLEGLALGRYEIFAVWEAPCSARAVMGAADSCIDPSEVLGLFWAPVSGPGEASMTRPARRSGIISASVTTVA